MANHRSIAMQKSPGRNRGEVNGTDTLEPCPLRISDELPFDAQRRKTGEPG